MSDPFGETVIFLEGFVVETLFTNEMFSFLEASGNSVMEEGGFVGNRVEVTEVPVTTRSKGLLGADHRYGDALEKL